MGLNSRGIVLNFKFFEKKACSTHSVYLAIIFKVKQITCLTSTNPNGFLTNVFFKNSVTKTSSICFAVNMFSKQF